MSIDTVEKSEDSPVENGDSLDKNKPTTSLPILKGMLIIAVVAFTVLGFYLNSKVLFEGYEYGKVEQMTLEVITLPETKETKEFLFYVQAALSDRKLTKWESFRINLKYQDATNTKKTAELEDKADSIATLAKDPN